MLADFESIFEHALTSKDIDVLANILTALILLALNSIYAVFANLVETIGRSVLIGIRLTLLAFILVVS